MRILVWILRGVVFFILLGFALKNDAMVSLSFFLGTQWHLPLIAVILAAFAAGVVLGVTAAVLTMLHQRREIRRLRETVQTAPAKADAPAEGVAGPLDYPRSV